jgi:mycothiol synthase
MLRAGYRRIYLLTDDFRLPAIKTYLRLGFVPFLFEEGMEQRWREVLRRLEWPEQVLQGGRP